ncbi:TPA: colicin immunity protein Cui [Klebsiella oxytoca]
MGNTTVDNRYANRALLFVTLACIIPLLIIFSVSLSNPGSPFLNQIADATRSTPSVTSAFNPVMTKVMDIYVKSAPVAGILAFMFLLKKRKPLEIKKRAELIRACFLRKVRTSS